MPTNPKVSIVLPTYNQAQFLREAITGIVEQTFSDYELVVVDDGSTDSTPELLRELGSEVAFKHITQSNRGLARALNRGFSDTVGEYLTWTSSDNIMLASMLEVLASALDDDPALGVAYADWFFINEQGDQIGRYRTLDFDRHLLLRQNFVHCCFLFKRECLERAGGYDPAFKYYEDWEFWVRVSREFRMLRISTPLYLYRLHSSSMTTEILSMPEYRDVSYQQFAGYLRNLSPFDWYYSKVKWALLILRSGSDPRKAWLRATTSI